MPRQGAATGRYRMSSQGQPTQRGLQGMYVLQDKAGCQVYRPTWNGTRTIFRVFPAHDPEDPSKWDPFRLSDEDRDWGDWIRRYDMVFGLGNPGVTFITKSPYAKDIDDQQNPVWMLQRAISQAVKAGTGNPSWNPLIFGAAGRGAPITAPKDGYVMQGILMEHKSNPQNPPRGCLLEHQPVVLLMSQSAGGALLDRLNEKTEDGSWAHPDITSLDGGLFVQFHQAGTQNTAQAGQPARQMGQNQSISGGGAGGNVADANRYEVEFKELYNGISPAYEGLHAVAEAHVKPWDEIVRIPDIEAQVKLICSAGIPASAITYALGDVYRDFIPQHIWDQSHAQTAPNTTPFDSTQTPAGDANTSQTQASPMGSPETATPPEEQPVAQTAAATAGSPMTQAPPPEEQPVAQTAAATAGAPMTQAAPSEQPAPTAEAQGYDSQPQSADPTRASDTMDAIARARQRAAAAQTG